MDSYRQEMQNIKKILKENPKGMTVTDISRKIKINRNSVAKYLDIMRISGQVEMITFGPAKVFFPSKRIHISNLINFTSDYILVIDKNLKITMINDSFLEFLNSQRKDIIGDTINASILKFLKENLDLSLAINEAIEGKGYTKEINFEMHGDDLYFKIKIIPTTFNDGKHGVSLIIKNKTDRMVIENALRESNKNFHGIMEKISKDKK